MGVFEMVFGIVVVVMIASVLKSFFGGRKEGLSESMDNMMDEMGMGDYCTKKKIEPYLKKIDAMEERLRNLERIATDRGRNLADEIDRLK